MNTQQIQGTLKNAKSTAGNVWLWLGLGLLLIVAALAIQNISRRATTASIPETGSPFQDQSVPDAASQGVANYINAHSSPFAQSVPEAGVQSVADYIRLHSNDLPEPAITDPAVQSVMDYLKAHGIQP